MRKNIPYGMKVFLWRTDKDLLGKVMFSSDLVDLDYIVDVKVYRAYLRWCHTEEGSKVIAHEMELDKLRKEQKLHDSAD